MYQRSRHPAADRMVGNPMTAQTCLDYRLHVYVRSRQATEDCFEISKIGVVRNAVNQVGKPKPIPRWDVHFGEIDDARKDSTAPHITFRPQPGGHR